MSHDAKAFIVLGAVLITMLGYLWLAHWVWHLLPDPNYKWWEIPAVGTTVFFAIAAAAASALVTMHFLDRKYG